MRKTILLVVLIAIIAVAAIFSILRSNNNTNTPTLDAVKIDAELQQLYSKRDANWCWAKLQHNKVGAISVNGRNYPVYYDKKFQAVYTSLSGKRAYDLSDQNTVDTELQKYAKRLGINYNFNYNSGSIKLLVNAKPTPYDTKIERLNKKFDLAMRQVEHKPLVSNGSSHRVLSDPTYQYFVVISPSSANGPKNSELDAYITKIAAKKGHFYRRICCETAPDRWQWLKRINPRWRP